MYTVYHGLIEYVMVLTISDFFFFYFTLFRNFGQEYKAQKLLISSGE